MNDVTTTENESYSRKDAAARAARKALGADATPGIDFRIVPAGERFTWAATDPSPRKKGEDPFDALDDDGKVDKLSRTPAGGKNAPAEIPGRKPTPKPEIDAAGQITFYGLDGKPQKIARDAPASELVRRRLFPTKGAAREARAVQEAADARKAAGVTDSPVKAAIGKRAAIVAAAEAGTLPTPPDFSSDGNKRYRETLAAITAAAERGDVKALKAFEIKTYSSSPKAMDRYRNLCIVAVQAKAKGAAR